jgi:deoxyribodipyrimidine photo-lyase
MSRRCLVWLKRDLRSSDHAPLAAAGCRAAAVLYVVEPAWTGSPEFDPQHLAFAARCLEPLREQLAALGLPLLIRHGPVPEVLEALRERFAFDELLSHEETGPLWSYRRDQAVARWCAERGVRWREFTQSGVVRRLRDRDGWAARWQARMDAPQEQPAAVRGAEGLEPGALSAPASRPLPEAGSAAAWALLDSFLAHRSVHYRATLSSPLSAAQGCSRLSPHLAFGTISLREVHQATRARLATLRADGSPVARQHAEHLRGFAGRLRWHCHFMQKLEDETAIEHRNFARSLDGLREGAFRTELFDAWREGRTGFPMVDACMRSLNATGWLNFRMRAMLVSFAAYHLWLHWREPGLHLARQFLDFEPGIHWSQMQMQSGTTGINTLRIYSPAKQATDHDPQGEFVRRWLPEWGTRDYPPPIVDERTAVARAKEQLYGLRRQAEVRAEADRIQARHGSRKSGLGPKRRVPSPETPQQTDLFD